MRRTILSLLLLCASFPGATFAGQSLVLPATGQATNANVPAQTGDCRIEGLLQNWPSAPNNSNIAGNPCGVSFHYCNTCGNTLQVYWVLASGGICAGGPYVPTLTGFSPQAMYFRYQQTVAGNSGAGLPARTNTLEIWNSSGVRVFPNGSSGPSSGFCTWTTLSGSPGAGASLGDTGSSGSSTIGFYRVYNTLVPMGSQMPVTAPVGIYASGCIFHWTLDNTLADACGHYPAALVNTPCGSGSCYTPTGPIQSLVVAAARTLNAPAYSNWISLRAGYPNQLDGSQSFSQTDGSSTVTYAWQGSGPSEIIWSSQTAAQPIVSGLVFGSYTFFLHVVDVNGNSTLGSLEAGAVAYDGNGVVIPPNPAVSNLFGPQIAFGQNPWGFEDERNLFAVSAQAPYWNANYDTTWATPGTGTISYPFSGKGFAPGPSCTTLSSSVTATATAIPVTNASCLSLSSLPTWILIGTAFNVTEMVRICGATAMTGPATLTVCYDGRGMTGNAPQLYSPGPASAWPMGTLVGEFRIQGAGTLFSTDSVRPICPAGIPGPPGAVAYSTGTATLAASSTTVTGSGTTWTTANGVQAGGYIRMAATHGGGTAFVFWRQIVTVTDATHLVLDHAAPSDIDGAAFSYQITSPAMYLSLEFNAADGHIARALFTGVGCESDAAMFAILGHDVPALDSVQMPTTGTIHYSYKTFFGLYASQGLGSPDFYGPGLAARNFYYRSGYGPALAYANAVDEYATRDPEIADGIAGGANPLAIGGMVVGSMVDLILNSSTVLTWPNLEQFARSGAIGGAGCNAYDTRSAGYLTAFTTLASIWDTNSANAAAFTTALQAVLASDQTCRRNASDGYAGAEVNSFANGFVFNTTTVGTGNPSALTLTAGSTAVTGAGFTNGSNSAPGYCYGVDIAPITVTHGSSIATVTAGTLSQQSFIYITDTTSSPINVGVFEYSVSGSRVQLAGVWPGASGTFSAMSTTGGTNIYGSLWTGNADTFANNRALEKVWACRYNSPTSLTLNRPWDGPTGSSYYFSYYNVGAFGQQPFFFGIKMNQMVWATKSSNSALANGYAALIPGPANWYNSFGWDSTNNHGTFYDTVAQVCANPNIVAAGSFNSISGEEGCGNNGLAPGNAAIERVDSAEGGSAMIQFYLANPTLNNKAIVDRFYGAMFGNVPYCAASVVFSCDGITASQLDNGSLSGTKWAGFYFGMGGFFDNSWPAVRNGGVQAARTRTEQIGFTLDGAASVRVTVTAPSGAVSAVTCTSAPCAITVDDRQGSHSYQVQHLSGSGEVLATAAPVLLPLPPQP